MGVLIALAVVCLGLLYGTGVDGAGAVPDRTATVQVHAGETLWDVAQRMAPGSEPSAVVERIKQLNGLGGTSVYPGQSLTVPSGR
ncbi:LysM peptidoglycan-binding domain-containing protein [Solihabitans fulvus]|uniref:LysM peptidoglycan-binding domain-containing protein n=1 Tax=Solihabitans fulvus TaxID=1892852 RepID=A0A5B2WTX2_9PSEU|nr:LysM peptidoglycan-binding domain-containing protein [Solihabitans fulvus]